IGLLDGVEGDFQDDLRCDGADGAVAPECDLAEASAQGSDLLVGESGVSLADGDEFLSITNGEGVVGELSGALAVALLDGGDDDVEGRRGFFPLAPGTAAFARLVERVPAFQDEPFVSS